MPPGPLLQVLIVVACCGVLWLGLFQVPHDSLAIVTAWILGAVALKAAYQLAFQLRGRRVAAIEYALPALDLSCVTVAWVAIGELSSPVWATYVFVLLSYGRPGRLTPFPIVAASMAANVAIALALFATEAQARPGDAATILAILAAMTAVAGVLGRQSRSVEARARRLAEIDPLTGVANRRMFLGRMGEVTGRSDAPYSVLMLDLDNFKQLNDIFGHAHGDVVLTRVARVLQDSLREGDLLARYGGEEFVVLLPDTSSATAYQVGERLRRSVANYTPTTVSIGVAVKEPGESPTSVMLRADGHLLQAKRMGKNTVNANASLPTELRQIA